MTDTDPVTTLHDTYTAAEERAVRAGGPGTAIAITATAITAPAPLIATLAGAHGTPLVAIPTATAAYAIARIVRLARAEQAARAHWENLSRTHPAAGSAATAAARKDAA